MNVKIYIISIKIMYIISGLYFWNNFLNDIISPPRYLECLYIIIKDIQISWHAWAGVGSVVTPK